jgi:hypothetical protein
MAAPPHCKPKEEWPPGDDGLSIYFKVTMVSVASGSRPKENRKNNLLGTLSYVKYGKVLISCISEGCVVLSRI